MDIHLIQNTSHSPLEVRHDAISTLAVFSNEITSLQTSTYLAVKREKASCMKGLSNIQMQMRELDTPCIRMDEAHKYEYLIRSKLSCEKIGSRRVRRLGIGQHTFEKALRSTVKPRTFRRILVPLKDYKDGKRTKPST
jgi:hypothetical protein